MTEPYVRLARGVKSLPGGNRVLRGVELAVARGEAVAIVGRSGSGKSTLLAGLGLISPFDRGTVYEIDGRDATALSSRELSRFRGSTIGFVLQNSGLIGHLSALDNVRVPLMHGRAVGLREGRKRSAEALDRLGLGAMLKRKPTQLSGGERQRVAIARALVVRPRLILADEPTGALDVTTGNTVLAQMLEAVRGSGVALIIVTHDRDVAEIADRTLQLLDGRLVESAPGATQ